MSNYHPVTLLGEDYIRLRQAEILLHATELGMDEELMSYTKQIQTQLSTDGDEAYWFDFLEMAYNELIINRLG
jgi:hypothetical protein